MTLPLRRILPATDGTLSGEGREREWLVTNGLGGYACGTIGGAVTRRYHGLLVAGLAAPQGRTMMLSGLLEHLRVDDDTVLRLGDPEWPGADAVPSAALREFRLEAGLPVWTFEAEGIEVERRVLMPHRQNTVYIVYRLQKGPERVRLELYPALHVRPADASVDTPQPDAYAVTILGDRYEIAAPGFPPLRIVLAGDAGSFTVDRRLLGEVLYEIEAGRGYQSRGNIWSPGAFRLELTRSRPAALIASTERPERMCALTPAQAEAAERERRRQLLRLAGLERDDADPVAAELTLAADQFLVTPAGRVEDSARARAAGYEVRTVIAGYHWFTDWGRDTMISLEGLTLATGRHLEASSILRTFAYAVRDGLIPNLFPEGRTSGLYHTADASLWFVEAVARYLRVTGDRDTLRLLMPRLREIVERHLGGTRFGIGVDPRDGLLRQGEAGYQLTWMDAKVDDWVVTPRRGKAVEINALWYNALRLAASWEREEGGTTAARELDEHAERARRAFNERFWYEAGHHLYDVVDGEGGDDPSLRPNQVLALALTHPVLDRARWEPVVAIVRERLLTPVGLRTLPREHPDYKPRYFGDLRTRDAAYHQGTVWPWLLGPFVDAWLRVHPGDRAGARALLQPLAQRLGQYCVGTLAEIFDAEEPFLPRGCVAQAWSVAELLRAWRKTGEAA